MKKIKYLSMAISALALVSIGTLSVDAKLLTATDLDDISKDIINGEVVYNNIYIIGNHLFTNVIDLNDIMTASRTIVAGEPNAIYRRDTSKSWMNSLTGKPLADVPANFEVKMADRKELADPKLTEKLTKLIDQAKALTAKEYTKTSYDAIDAALKLKDVKEVEKEAKFKALTDAFNKKEFINQKELNDLIKLNDSRIENDYTGNFQAFKDAYALAKAMPETTLAEINVKITNLKAVGALLTDKTISKLALTSAISNEYSDNRVTLKLTNSSEYTPASWFMYVTTLTDAIKVESLATLQSQLDAAVTAIGNAKKGLEFTNYAELVKAKDIKALNKTDYVKGWTELEAVLNTAETTFAEITTKIAAINTAKENLITKTADTALTEAKAEGNKVKNDNSIYTTESFGKLTAAIAKTPVTNKNYIDQAKEILDAIKNLKFAGQDALTAELNKNKGLVTTDYNTGSWDDYTKALTIAMAMTEKTNAEVVSKTEALKVAYAKLTPIVADKTALTALIDAQYAKSGETVRGTITLLAKDYDSILYGKYNDAIIDALAVEANAKALNSNVDAAKEVITKTKAALVFKNKAELDKLKADFVKLVQAEYTKESYDALSLAIIGTTDDETTNDKIIAKIAAINTANKLVFANLADLTAAKVITTLKEADYSVANWTNLTNAIKADAEAEKTFAGIAGQIKLINDAKAVLTNEANKQIAELKALDEQVKALVKADYDVTLYNAVDTANKVVVTTYLEKDAKITAVTNAIKALKFTKTAELEQLKGDVTTKEKTKYLYTDESWAAITVAMALPEGTNALEIAKLKALDKANKALITVAAVENIKTTLATLTDKDAAHYTKATWDAYVLLRDKTYTTDAEAVQLNTDLIAAIKALVFVNEKTLTDLEAVYTELVKNKANYTDNTWNAYETVMTAKDSTKFTTYKEFADEIIAINGAKSKLVLKNTVTLNTLKAELEKLVEVDYTSDSWKAYMIDFNKASIMLEGTHELNEAKVTALTDAKAKLISIKALQTLIDAQYNGNPKTLTITNKDKAYSDLTYNAYVAELAKAEALVKKVNATEKEITDEVTALTAARNGLAK